MAFESFIKEIVLTVSCNAFSAFFENLEDFPKFSASHFFLSFLNFLTFSAHHSISPFLKGYFVYENFNGRKIHCCLFQDCWFPKNINLLNNFTVRSSSSKEIVFRYMLRFWKNMFFSLTQKKRDYRNKSALRM